MCDILLEKIILTTFANGITISTISKYLKLPESLPQKFALLHKFAFYYFVIPTIDYLVAKSLFFYRKLAIMGLLNFISFFCLFFLFFRTIFCFVLLLWKLLTAV